MLRGFWATLLVSVAFFCACTSSSNGQNAAPNGTDTCQDCKYHGQCGTDVCITSSQDDAPRTACCMGSILERWPDQTKIQGPCYVCHCASGSAWLSYDGIWWLCGQKP